MSGLERVLLPLHFTSCYDESRGRLPERSAKWHVEWLPLIWAV
jgi:hypothetical protein